MAYCKSFAFSLLGILMDEPDILQDFLSEFAKTTIYEVSLLHGDTITPHCVFRELELALRLCVLLNSENGYSTTNDGPFYVVNTLELYERANPT